jgi:hypothetical protein
MTNRRRCTYKGYTIITRWIELEPSRRGLRRFTASFSVDQGAPGRTSWQEFMVAVFHTFDTAAENALTSAKRSIDLKLAER